MGTPELHRIGVSIERLAKRVGASNHLKGTDADNSADYYDSSGGMYDGLAACLEALAVRLQAASTATALSDVATKMNQAAAVFRSIDPTKEDPFSIPTVLKAQVAMIAAAEELTSLWVEPPSEPDYGR
jgi:hypothetical protein